MNKLIVIGMMGLFLMSVMTSAYTFDNKIIREKLSKEIREDNHKDNYRRNTDYKNDKEIIISKKSGGGCITQWAYNGEEWIKLDLINPHNKKLISGEWCIAFDMNTRQKVDPPLATPTEVSDLTPLPTTWANYRNKHLW